MYGPSLLSSLNELNGGEGGGRQDPPPLLRNPISFVRDAPSLPAFTNTRRLKLSTLVLILYSAFVTFVTQPVIFHFSGNIILVKSISLVITSFSPLVIVQMEKDILDFVREVMNGEAFN